MSNIRIYFYRVLLPHGAFRQGMLQMMVERDHSARLRLERETEGTVLTLWRLPGWMVAVSGVVRGMARRSMRLEDLAGFLRDMGLMLKAGVPAVDALRTLSDEGRSSGNRGVSRIAVLLAEDLQSGISTAQAFARYPHIFPETVRNLVLIGDRSGTLNRMLSESSEHIERIMSIRRGIRTAMIYPAFVFATIFAAAAFWLYYVVPNMARLFKQLNAKMPPLTEGLVRFADVLADHIRLVSVCFCAVVLATVWLFTREGKPRTMLHNVLHRLPVTRVMMTASGMAHLTEHLAILVRAGLDFVSSIDILQRATRDRYYQQRLLQVRESVARGDRMSVAMNRAGGFPPMAVRMIAVGEESGSLDVQLAHLAAEYRKRLDAVVMTLSEIIKPAIILVAGALFLFLIVALLLPVYDMIQQSTRHSLGG
jgi:type II secretory pathway component PulF